MTSDRLDSDLQDGEHARTFFLRHVRVAQYLRYRHVT
jgi:hypothetical protein